MDFKTLSSELERGERSMLADAENQLADSVTATTMNLIHKGSEQGTER